MLDVMNEEDKLIEQAMRSVVHARGLWHRGIHIFLVDNGGRLLVQKRSTDRATAPSALDCSVSEHVKAGENYLEAAQRGLAEELGLTGVKIAPLVRFRMNYGPNDNEICVLYEGRVDAAEVRFDPVEIERVDYYSLSELQTLMQDGKTVFSKWFGELLRWTLGLPSEMEIIETCAESHLLPRP
jgi:isopentenyl-diphosphate delta-isomerase